MSVLDHRSMPNLVRDLNYGPGRRSLRSVLRAGRKRGTAIDSPPMGSTDQRMSRRNQYMSGWVYSASERLHGDEQPQDPDYIRGLRDGADALKSIVLDGVEETHSPSYREGWCYGVPGRKQALSAVIGFRTSEIQTDPLPTDRVWAIEDLLALIPESEVAAWGSKSGRR